MLFNEEISTEEIVFAVKNLKVGKACGPDNVKPEAIVFGLDVVLPILARRFNRVFLKGQFPITWNESVIVTIHKNGSIQEPNNYRGISLQNCLGKIYTSIINRRLTFYAQIYNRISEAQAGFRPQYSRIDNAFTLNTLIENALNRLMGNFMWHL